MPQVHRVGNQKLPDLDNPPVISIAYDGPYLISSRIQYDTRGSFQKLFSFNLVQTLLNESKYKLNPIIDMNESFTKKAGVVRGLHMQMEPAAETKIVRCVTGRIWDVAVDMRPFSDTYLQHFSFYLDGRGYEERTDSVIIPRGFAHGFQTLTDDCLVQYLVDCEYHPELEVKIYSLDQELCIPWPERVNVKEMSSADRTAKSLKDAQEIIARGNV